MDGSDLVAWSPITRRPRLTWPNGARVAVWVVPNVEHYEYLPKDVRARDPWPRTPHPDVLGYGARDYGNRVGIWRLFQVLDDLGIRCTTSLSMRVIQHYPRLHEAMQKRGWEYMSHGLYNTRYHWGYGEAEEAAVIAECNDIHERLVGGKLPGWFSPAASYTVNTHHLVAEAGITYWADIYHDDQPFPVKVRSGSLVTVPYSMDLNDAILTRRPDDISEFDVAIRDHFDTVYAEGAEHGRVMCVALHPYWIGQPHRIEKFRRTMEYILGHSGVWMTTGGAIARHCLDHHVPALRAQLAEAGR
jgi:peptidoglycan/xylan/chitin deacetylase (PgdA/CDA1 family)